MKKIIMLILSAFIAVSSLSGCGGDKLVCTVHDYGKDYPLCSDVTCKVCGQVKKASAFHEYGEWGVVLEATCYSMGLRDRTCLKCGYKEVSNLNKLPDHVYLNGECKYCHKKQNDGSQEPVEMDKITFGNDKLSAENCELSVVDNGYSGGGALKLLPYADESVVWFFGKDLAEARVGALKSLDFRMKINGKSGNYSQNVKLKNASGTVLDYAYPENVWNRITVDGIVTEVQGEKCLCFILSGINGQDILLSDFVAGDDVVVLDNIFGGVKFIQWQYPAALMQCYIIVSPDGTVMIVDGGADGTADRIEGAEKALYSYLKSNNWLTVDHWFITHFHNDHIGSLTRILSDKNKDITVKNVYFDFPDRTTCEKYNENYSNIETFLQAVETAKNSDGNKKVLNKVTPSKTDKFVLDDYMTVKVLNDAYFYSASNMGNDSSLVYKLETPGASVAFLGDMSYLHEKALLNDLYFYEEISVCEVIQMGHHGQGGCSEAFYKECKSMQIALYPAASWVFDARNNATDPFASNGLKTIETRCWTREAGVKYVFGGDSVFILE